MPELMLPGEPGLLVPKPVIEVGTMGGATTTAAALASDYTWSMIIATMACAVMVVVSAMKGVRRFSFAFTYTNLWYIFGKRGRLRVRVQSFTSTNGSNCFVTTSGEFTAELVKEDEEEDGEKQLDSSFPAEPSVAKPASAGKAGCIVGTEMVFIYNNTTSIFSTGSLSRVSGKKSYREALCKSIRCCSSLSLSKQDSFSRRALAVRAAGELPEWQLGVRRALAAGAAAKLETEGHQSFGLNSLVPEWALSLLEPLEIARITSSFPLAHHRERKAASRSPSGGGDYPWDAVMKLRLAGAEECRRGPSHSRQGEQEFIFPSGVVAGAAHTASLRNNVVKLWDNSTRLPVSALPVRPSPAFISSLDVDWKREMGVIGSSSGELSLWDLARAQCVTSFPARGSARSIESVRVNAAEQSEHDGWVVTSERSGEDCGSCVSLWDTRALSAAAAGRTRRQRKSAGQFSSVEDLMFRDYEVVARDESCRISMLDIRKLNSSSPVFDVSADEVSRSERGGRQGGAQDEEEEEMWWDDAASAAAANAESTEEDVYFDGDWIAVAGDQETVKYPSVLSRCFNALSSAISR
ncbi:hypothetical protein Mapa_002442 [Marchantia paleacea]|nr:hypothetical protein Mapa_002442 [Marchantia paleacea]